MLTEVSMNMRLLIATMLLMLALVTRVSLAQDKPKIYIGPSSKTLGYSPLWVGWKKSFFEQQGLDV